jgi:mannose-6-phosphate isomerase-like protein (cupin superfamily)
MELIDTSTLAWVNVTWDDARHAEAASIAFGRGDAHVRVLRMGAGGEIGEHETGFGQVFVPIEGRGWVRQGEQEASVKVGSAVYVPRGVLHAKGSDTGLLALVVQVTDLQLGGEV